MASAATSFLSVLFHRIEAQLSGEMTPYTLNCSITRRSHTPMANAPPDPPSPIMMLNTGAARLDISNKLRAMASLCPRSSEPMPGYAPGVSIKVITGMRKRSAMRIKRSALR